MLGDVGQAATQQNGHARERGVEEKRWGAGATVEQNAKLGAGGALIIMHGRSRMTISPRIPTMPGRSTSDFH